MRAAAGMNWEWGPGLMSGARRSRGSGTRQAPPAAGAARLTARGAILILFGVSLAGLVIANWFDQPWACGVIFVIGCLAAGLWVRPSDTHLLVATPPLVYFAALLLVEIVDGLTSGKFLQVASLGLVLNLSAELFWLLGGTVLMVVICWFRGLPAAWSDFRAELRGEDPDDEPEPYGPPAGYRQRPAPPQPRRPADPYGGRTPVNPPQPPPSQPHRRAPGAVPPRWNGPRPDAPPRGGYPPRPGGYPPRPSGYR